MLTQTCPITAQRGGWWGGGMGGGSGEGAGGGGAEASGKRAEVAHQGFNHNQSFAPVTDDGYASLCYVAHF